MGNDKWEKRKKEKEKRKKTMVNRHYNRAPPM